MKTMTSKALVAVVVLSGMVGGGVVYADETLGEKAAATTNDAMRATKKGAHRVEEATCMQSDTKCMEEKAKHRAQESSDYAKDKSKEVKNAMDSDDKK